MPRFAGRAAEREREKAERLAGAVERGAGAPRAARGRRIPTTSSGPTASRRPPRADLAAAAERWTAPSRALGPRELVARAGEAGLAALVRGRTRRPAPPPVRPRARRSAVIFKGMERAFVPEQAGGFEGEIRYELGGRDGARSWTVRIGDGRASGAPAAARRRARGHPARQRPGLRPHGGPRGLPAEAAARGRAGDRGRLRRSPAAWARCSASAPDLSHGRPGPAGLRPCPNRRPAQAMNGASACPALEAQSTSGEGMTPKKIVAPRRTPRPRPGSRGSGCPEARPSGAVRHRLRRPPASRPPSPACPRAPGPAARPPAASRRPRRRAGSRRARSSSRSRSPLRARCSRRRRPPRSGRACR